MLFRPRLWAVVLSLFVMIPSADGQTPRPQPKLFQVLPPGGRLGTVVDITVGGAELEGADGLWFSRAGIVATPVAGKPGQFKVVIDKTVSIGDVDLRVISPEGVSNPRTFVIGDRPESMEAEPNNGPETSNPITINSVVNGSIAATDLDCFTFEGKKGARLFLDLSAVRIDSKLDATLRLLDERGIEFAESRDVFGADPFLDVTLPKDGKYVVKIHDVTYAGSAEHVYRLTVHDGPHLDSVVPVIATANVASSSVLIGRKLGGTALVDVPIDGRSRESKPIDFTPRFNPSSDLAVNLQDSATIVRGREIRIGAVGASSNPLLVFETALPTVTEREPNGIEAPQLVTPPVAISGDFRAPGDLDVVRFAAKKGEVWRIEAVAEGIGSAADPSFVLQRVPEKGEPSDIAAGDDSPDVGLAPWFNVGSVDAAIRWQVPEDGTYQILLNDVAGTSRGDPRLNYVLSIRRERPDFRLFLVPGVPNALGELTVRKGGRVAATAVVWRLDGFSGPIWVFPSRLPAGVRCDPVIIPTGQNFAMIVFEADATAASVVEPIQIFGISAETTPSPGSGLETPHDAIPISIVRPGNPAITPVMATTRATRGYLLAVRDVSPFLFTVRPTRPVVALGEAIELQAVLSRGPNFDEPIQVAVGVLPAGFAAPTGTVAKGSTTGTLSWPTPKGAAAGLYSLGVRGASTWKPDPKAKPNLNYKLDEPANTFFVRLQAAPISIKALAKPPEIKAGTQIELGIEIDRVNQFPGPVAVRVEFPPNSTLKSEPLTIVSASNSGKLILRETSGKPSPTPIAARLRAEAIVAGDAIEVTAPLSITIAKP